MKRDDLKNPMDKAIATMNLTNNLHLGAEATKVRTCMGQMGLKKEADAWKADVDDMSAGLTKLKTLVAKADTGGDRAAQIRTFMEITTIVGNISAHISRWNRMMSQDSVLAALRSEPCVQHFFKFLKRMFESNAKGLDNARKIAAKIAV
jgi:hypothetical protein